MEKKEDGLKKEFESKIEEWKSFVKIKKFQEDMVDWPVIENGEINDRDSVPRKKIKPFWEVSPDDTLIKNG